MTTLQNNPANKAKDEQAVVKQIRIANANYWVIDRLVQRGADNGGGYIIGDYNIFNNMLFEHAPRSQLYIYNGSDYNTVQFSVCREQTIFYDTMCFGITDNRGPAENGSNENHTLGNRFISNEIYDYTDGIQLVHSSSNPGPGYQDMSGTIIDDNDIYLTERRYVNEDGELDPKGDYACAENGIDIKVGGTGHSLASRVTVSNNRIWGMRRSNCPTMSDPGTAISTPQSGVDINYLQIEGNIVFSNARGMTVGSNGNTGIVIRNNIITDSRPAPSTPHEYGISSPDPSIGDPMLIQSNAISGYFHWTGAEKNKYYLCNYVLDSGTAGKRALATGKMNSYFVEDYLSNKIGGESTDDYSGTPSDSRFENACFLVKSITDPQLKCLENAIPSASTPKAVECEFSIPLLSKNGLVSEPTNIASPPSSPQLLDVTTMD